MEIEEEVLGLDSDGDFLDSFARNMNIGNLPKSVSNKLLECALSSPSSDSSMEMLERSFNSGANINDLMRTINSGVSIADLSKSVNTGYIISSVQETAVASSFSDISYRDSICYTTLESGDGSRSDTDKFIDSHIVIPSYLVLNQEFANIFSDGEIVSTIEVQGDIRKMFNNGEVLDRPYRCNYSSNDVMSGQSIQHYKKVDTRFHLAKEERVFLVQCIMDSLQNGIREYYGEGEVTDDFVKSLLCKLGVEDPNLDS